MVKKDQKGFTIIEVLIVLAIAGLILLIVFLAVPALQRNSRNTAARNDVQNVLGGVAEFQSINNGRMPTNVAGTGTVNYTGATNDTSIEIQGSTVVDTAPGYPSDVGEINVQIGAKCDGSSVTRAVNAKFLIESASGTVQQCQDS